MLPATELLIRDARRDHVPAIVLLHFFGGSRREWIETSLLLGSSFRVISIDTPGFGEASDVPGYSVAEMADTFAATLAELRLDRYMLVGHSMTGKIAAVLASRKLPGLAKLGLLTASPLSPEPVAAQNRATMLAQAEPTREEAEQYVRTNSSLALRPEVFERAVEDRLRANPAAWRAWMESGTREDWSDRVGVLDLPTLIVAAEKDGSLGPDVQRKLTLPHYANAQFEVVPQSGHLVPMEAPEKLADLLSSFAEK